MRNPFWFQVVITNFALICGYFIGKFANKGQIEDLEFEIHILESEAESAWHQLYVQTYGDKSEVKIVEESELDRSKRNHPSNGNKNEDSYCVACYELSVPCDKCAEERLRFVANNLIPQIKKNKASKENKEIDEALKERIRKEWNQS
jgi:hypothetical protein